MDRHQRRHRGFSSHPTPARVKASSPSLWRRTPSRLAAPPLFLINDTRTTVAQDAAPCRFELNAGSAEVAATGRTVTVGVSAVAGCAWTVGERSLVGSCGPGERHGRRNGGAVR